MLTGTIVNTLAIIAGAMIGVIAKKAIPQRMGDLVMSAIPIVVMVLGVQFGIASSNILIVIVSLVVGGIIGEWIDIDRRLDDFGVRIQSRMKGGDSNFSAAFVSTTLIYCVGSMAILGSIESGINGNHTIHQVTDGRYISDIFCIHSWRRRDFFGYQRIHISGNTDCARRIYWTISFSGGSD